MAIAEVWVRCDVCQGTGERPTIGGSEICHACENSGRRMAFSLDADLVDKLNDMMDKLNDIFEVVSGP